MVEVYQKDFYALMKQGSCLDKKGTITFSKNFLPYDTEESQERLEIYHNNVLGSLSNVLGVTYPLCKALIGKDFFRKISHTYVKDYFPTQPSLLFWGEEFPDFINNFGRTHNYAYWGDLALAEWYLNSVFYAKDQEFYELKDLEALLEKEDYGRISLSLIDACMIQKSPFNLPSLLSFLKEKGAGDLVGDIDQETHLIYYRDQDLKAQYLAVDSVYFEALVFLRVDSGQEAKTLEGLTSFFVDQGQSEVLGSFIQFLFQLRLLRKE